VKSTAPIASFGALRSSWEVLLHPNCTQVLAIRFHTATATAFAVASLVQQTISAESPPTCSTFGNEDPDVTTIVLAVSKHILRFNR
jgi:hypothetical protein